MPAQPADQIGLPLDYDWWLLDDERVITCTSPRTGEIDGKELVTEPGVVARIANGGTWQSVTPPRRKRSPPPDRRTALQPTGERLNQPGGLAERLVAHAQGRRADW